MPLLTRRAMMQGLLAQALWAQPSIAQPVVHRSPTPLAPSAVTHDWTPFLGPSHNAVSTETPLRRMFPPPLVWEFQSGSGYASPAIAGKKLVFVHRVGDEEIVECLHAETGADQWRFRYPTAYEDRYGYNNGPRSSPVIDGNHVFSIGAEGKFHALDLETGEVLWRRDFRMEYGATQDFFGVSSSPLVERDVVIVNVGGAEQACVVGFDRTTGRERWRAGNWGPSYASPVPATIHGQRRVFVFAGGESNPPEGGLLSIDPVTGNVDFSVSHRSRTYESVNAACPVVFGDKIFISASYRTGGTLVQVQPDFSHQVVWSTQEFALHFNTPIYRDGMLFGFDGRNQGDASLACVDVETGRIVWREVPTWTETVSQNGQTRESILGTARGSLLAADGLFLCLGEFGHLLWLDLTDKGYVEVARTWLFAARESWTLPVLSHGLLYVKQNTRDLTTGAEPRLLCYDLRG